MPVRPAKPPEALASGVELDRYVAASQAEIELREGYEGQLRAALADLHSAAAIVMGNGLSRG